MANLLYGKGREKFGDADIAWTAADIKMALVDTDDYSVNIDVDEFIDDVAGAAVVDTSGNFGTKANVLGVLDAADIVLSAVTGDESEALVIYKDTGTPATSPLIAYIDTASGLPVIPNGGDITIAWDSGANKILKL